MKRFQEGFNLCLESQRIITDGQDYFFTRDPAENWRLENTGVYILNEMHTQSLSQVKRVNNTTLDTASSTANGPFVENWIKISHTRPNGIT